MPIRSTRIRVATIDRGSDHARDKTGVEVNRQGRQPNFLTLVPVKVAAPANPFPH
ncbi:hypothetical protein ACFQVB_32455 [Paraburkholderia humisilvae]|uniref:hypothetical protein n=1 Tax=Paraburkholderia humisilvae TaxID=627669 RepID=UPI0036240103